MCVFVREREWEGEVKGAIKDTAVSHLGWFLLENQRWSTTSFDNLTMNRFFFDPKMGLNLNQFCFSRNIFHQSAAVSLFFALL